MPLKTHDVCSKNLPAGDLRGILRRQCAVLIFILQRLEGRGQSPAGTGSRSVSELMRVSGIIADNINKGAELNQKLERESEQLWLSRRLHAEEQGRLAETKMTLPLAIFLCVLIVITVAPAMLQL